MANRIDMAQVAECLGEPDVCPLCGTDWTKGSCCQAVYLDSIHREAQARISARFHLNKLWEELY